MEIIFGIVITLAAGWAFAVWHGAKTARRELFASFAAIHHAAFIFENQRLPGEGEGVGILLMAQQAADGIAFADLYSTQIQTRQTAEDARAYVSAWKEAHK